MTELAVTARPLPVIEAELDLLEQDTQQKETALIGNYIQVGRRLEEVKAQLPHGEWGPWLERRGYPQAKAVKLMKISQAYGQEQQNLFGGEAKSQAFANLGFHKLVQLLAIEDEEDRERFVAEHDVAAMSTRELEKALKERDEALQRAEQAESTADEFREAAAKAQADARAAEESRAKIEADIRLLKASGKDATEMEKKLLMAKSALKGQQEEAAILREDANKLRRELKELKEKPVDVAVEVREPTPEELARLTADAVEKARTEDAGRVLELEKQLAAADPDTAAFKVYFAAWQEDYSRMTGCLAKIAQRDSAKGEKLRRAVSAAVENMQRMGATG